MEPVRIKYLGLVSMTKRTYLIATGAAALFCVLALLAVYALGVPPFSRFPWDPELAARGLLPPLYNLWTLLLLVLLEGVDIGLSLRQFRKNEIERESRGPSHVSDEKAASDTHFKSADDRFRQRM